MIIYSLFLAGTNKLYSRKLYVGCKTSRKWITASEPEYVSQGDEGDDCAEEEEGPQEGGGRGLVEEAQAYSVFIKLSFNLF